MNRDGLRNEIVNYVGERRLPHVLGTERECLALASLFGLSDEETEKLAAAALLHDITKGFTTAEHIEFMESRGRSIDEKNLRSDKTLHALTGAFMARELYPELTDDTVFSAILFHTTGKEDMSLTQKLMYLADYIEPTRSFDDCIKLRNYFYGNIESGSKLKVLNDTLILSFDMTIENLIKQRNPIHPDTVAARNYLISRED